MRTATAMLALTATLIGVAPVQAQERRNLDGVFEEIQDAAGGRKILFTKDGLSYRVHPKAYTNAKRIWPFIKKGDKINIWVKGDILLKIEMGWKKTSHVNAKVMARIKKLKEGMRIRLNGQEFQFVGRKKGKLIVNQVLVDGEINPTETLIPYTKIKKLAILKKKEAADHTQAQADILKVFFVSAGDTVRLQMDKAGQTTYTGTVKELTPLTCTLLQWQDGEHGDSVTIKRRDVVKAFPTHLETRRAYSIPGGGNLSVKIKRFRREKEGPMTFDVSVRHDAEQTLLDRFNLGFNLSEDVASGVTDAPNPASVPMLFPGKEYTFKHAALHARYKDALIPKPDLKGLPYTSKAAEPHVLRFIGLIKNEDQLRELYLGRAASKDPAFLHLLISRTLNPPTGRMDAKLHEQLSAETLLASGAAGADAIVNEILLPDDSFELTTLQEGHLVRSQLPEKIDRGDWRKRLIVQLSNQRDCLADGRAEKLFEYFCLHEKYAVDLERVFFKNPEQTVSALFELAIPRSGSDENEQAKTSLAANLLRNMRGPGLDQVDKELAKRGIDTEEFVAARKKYGSKQAHKTIDVALKLAAETSKEEWLAGLEERVKEAQGLLKDKKYRPALEIVRDVLSKNPESKSAKKLFPKITIPLSKKLQNGEAALLLEETVEFSPAAKKPLGAMLLKGVTAEIDKVVIFDAPTAGGIAVRTPRPDERFSGSPKGDWIELELTKSKRGYVRNTCATRQGGEYVIAPETPFMAIDKTLARVRELNPDLSKESFKQFGHLNAREGAKHYDAGQYELAAPYFDKAQQFAPEDERLSRASSNWLQTNWQFLLLVIAFVFVACIAAWFVYKKIKEELVAAEDLRGQDLEIILEYGVDADEWRDMDDDEDDDDGVYAGAAAAPAAPTFAPPADGPPQG